MKGSEYFFGAALVAGGFLVGALGLVGVAAVPAGVSPPSPGAAADLTVAVFLAPVEAVALPRPAAVLEAAAVVFFAGASVVPAAAFAAVAFLAGAFVAFEVGAVGSAGAEAAFVSV